MYTNLNLQLICTECPKGMNEQNCPVRKCIKDESGLFNQSINENVITLAKPYNDARGKYEGVLSAIFEMCNDCKKTNVKE